MVQKKLTQVLVDHKEMQSREQFATMLETIAQKLRNEGKFTFIQGEKVVEVNPSAQLQVEVKYEVKRNKHAFEIEFEWRPGEESQQMTIQ